MNDEQWTPEQIVDFEEWFLEEKNIGEEGLLLRLRQVPLASRSTVRERLTREIDWRRQAIPAGTSHSLNSSQKQKIQDLEDKERYLTELFN